MNKKIIAIICALVLIVSVLPMVSAAEAIETNITSNAKIITNIPLADTNDVLKLSDKNNKSGMLTDSTKELKFPYYVEFNFANYMVELSDINLYSLMGKTMGITGLSVEYKNNNNWIPIAKSGVVFKWDKNDSSASEKRTLHLDEKITASSFRLAVISANLKNNQFRIEEIELIGKITGTTSKSNIKEISPIYASCAINEQFNINDKVQVILDDNEKFECNVAWDNYDLTKEGIIKVEGTIPFYKEKAVAIIDVYNPDKQSSSLKDHWAENIMKNYVAKGLLGSININANSNATMGNLALIMQRVNKYELKHTNKELKGVSKNDNKYFIYETVVENGVFKETFIANKEISRIDALSIILNSIDISKKTVVNEAKAGFSDVSNEDKAITDKAYGLGIISGGNSFRPNEPILITELMTMLSKTLSEGGASGGVSMEKTFADNEKALVNPNMGLFSYYLDNGTTGYDVHYDNDDYFEDIEGLSNIYIRVPWSVVEPEKDYYDFSIVDGIIQKFSKVGKQVSLRFTASETGYTYATPKWVFDDGAKAHWWDNGKLTMPYYNDEIFLKHLDDFLGEVAKRYDGNSNIAYIDIGSLGLWGEGHTGNSLYPLTPQEALTHMELHKKHFKKTPIIVLDDLGFGFNDRFTEQLKGDIIKLNLGLRNDGYAGEDGNMRFIRPEDIALADGIWQQAPIVMEPEHYSEMLRVGNWGDGMGLVDWIDKVHGTYLGLHGYVREFYNDNPKFAQAANMRIGYRILPESVKLQSDVNVHEKLQMEVNWKNVAAAPCYKGAYPTLTLKDENGHIVSAMVDSNFNVKDLPVAAPGKATAVKQIANFRMNDVLPGGKYKAYLSLGALDGTPEIKMPIDAENDGDDRYYIGDVNVKGDYGVKASKDANGNLILNFDFHGNPDYSYRAFWMNVALRDKSKEASHMPGDMYQEVPTTDQFTKAVKENKTYEYSMKLEVQNQYQHKPLNDKSSLIGKEFDVYFVMDTLSEDITPGMYLSDEGRDVFIGTAKVDENLNIIFEPK